ncbi:hypothetical protein KJ786_01855 [Patescibacteria group bacterium]|nr:hypothetical protein [Patescibacteria group bacterium]
MESLIRLPYTHINNFLEALVKNKIPDHLVTRYRMDEDFAERVSRSMIAEHLENPGRRFFIKVNSSLSLVELNDRIIEQRVLTLKKDIIESFEPTTVFPDHLVSNTKIRMEDLEVFLVSLHKETNEVEAVAILNDMGLESVTIEEALFFALQTRSSSFSQNYSIVVLAGKWIGDIVEEKNPVNFLDFGVTMSNNARISLCKPDFSPRTMFLVKKKKPQAENKK